MSPESTHSSSSYTSALSCGVLPFSSHFSAKVCLKAAFNIACTFQNLPMPPQSYSSFSGSSPSDVLSFQNPSVQHHRSTQDPRMMPMFACCAMQSSYAMVMLGYKAKAKELVDGVPGDRTESAVKRMLAQLQGGLTMILDALQNYTIAYEALAGMRGKLEIDAHDASQ
jgi:hypothetical protein